MSNKLNEQKNFNRGSVAVWLIIICVVVVVCGIFIFKKDSSKILEDVSKNVFVVKTETVQKRDLKHQLIASGSIKALEEATLFPRVSGKLKRNLLREGDRVQKDQTVSLIERDEVGAQYEPVIVPSTLSGVVAKIFLDPGENVTTATPVALVVNQSVLRIKVDVPERYVGEIYRGQKAVLTVEAFPDQKFEATLDVISPVVDSLSRSVAVEFRTNNPKGLLKAGMFARVDISLKEVKNVLSLSKKNIYEDQDGKNYVLVPSDDKTTAVRKDIEVKFKNNNNWEISGLNEGDEVLEFVYGIKDGSKIEIQK
ncbi:efflux RND transporter periplasmic adaptor subunit [Candidatus Ruminimicrobium bovinum]|uniref:efflux RND transporter periplasmic adaptor subunit n=1 Tax=Candidatus Ruminimicrobium bovinum TaxID=3242779 RepID=UPI0039B969C2